MTMTHSLAFIVVEDRQNKPLLLCRESAARAEEPLIVLSGTDAGPGYERLCRTYVHLSSNPPEFEKICFRRYFLLSEYLRAHPEHREFVLIDSDVLLFRGIGAHIRRVAGKADFSGSYMRTNDGWDPARYRRTSATGPRRACSSSSPSCSTPMHRPAAAGSCARSRRGLPRGACAAGCLT